MHWWNHVDVFKAVYECQDHVMLRTRLVWLESGWSGWIASPYFLSIASSKLTLRPWHSSGLEDEFPLKRVIFRVYRSMLIYQRVYLFHLFDGMQRRDRIPTCEPFPPFQKTMQQIAKKWTLRLYLDVYIEYKEIYKISRYSIHLKSWCIERVIRGPLPIISYLCMVGSTKPWISNNYQYTTTPGNSQIFGILVCNLIAKHTSKSSQMYDLLSLILEISCNIFCWFGHWWQKKQGL